MRILSSLSSRIVLFATIMVMVTSSLIACVIFFTSRHYFVEHSKEGLESQASLLSTEIKNSFDNVIKDLVMLSKTPPIEAIIRTSENKGQDPLSDSTLTEWKERLSVIFTAMLKVNNDYTQIRYIGIADDGKELVRVDQSRDDVYRIPDSALQKKADEVYFQDGAKLAKGSIIFSGVSYNREKGRIQVPLVPTIRAIMPIFSAKHELFALLVINLNYEKFIKDILQHAKVDENVILFNKAGDYFIYNAQDKSLQFYLSEDAVQQDQKITSLIGHIKQSPNIISETKEIFTSESRKSPLLTLMISANKEELFKNDYIIFNNIITLIIIITILAVSFTYVFSRWLMRHLRHMSKAIENSHPTDTNMDLPVWLNDEVGMLARSFSKKTALLNELAMTDSLTGLPNRKYFLTHFAKAIKRAQDDNTLVTVCFIDLDNFKDVNDNYGHEVGDELLVWFAFDLQANARELDFVGRLGGDEFAVVMEGLVGEDTISDIISRYSKLLHGRSYVIKDIPIRLSGSVGSATYPMDGTSPEELLKKADVAMYQQKASQQEKS